MKKLLTVAGVLSFVWALGLQSASADPFTLCVKNNNGKMNRGALGEEPAKGGCKNLDKWTEVTLATEENVLVVKSDLELIQEQLDTLKAEGISSLIGGGHDQEEGPFFYGQCHPLLCACSEPS